MGGKKNPLLRCKKTNRASFCKNAVFICLVRSYSAELQATVRRLAPECEVTYLLSEDGSGKGAAMVTAVAQRLARQSRLLDDSDGEDSDDDDDDQ